MGVFTMAQHEYGHALAREFEAVATFNHNVELESRGWLVAYESVWPELVAQVTASVPEQAWFQDNLDAGLRELGVAGVVAVDAHGRVVHIFAPSVGTDEEMVAVAQPAARACLKRDALTIGYSRQGPKLLRWWAAPVREDTGGLSYGVLVFVDAMDGPALDRLASSFQGSVSVVDPAEVADLDMTAVSVGDAVRAWLPLAGADGKPVAYLSVQRGISGFAHHRASTLAALAALVATVAVLLLSHWRFMRREVLRPIQALRASIESGSALPMREAGPAAAEFAEFGGVVQEYFAQQAELVDANERLSGRLDQANAELFRAAYEDRLTGLLSREGALKTLEQYLLDVSKTDAALVVGRLDLAGFSTLVEMQGHEAGDRYVLAMVDLLVRVLGDHAACARVAHDDFILAFRPALPMRVCYALAESVIDSASELNEPGLVRGATPCFIGLAGARPGETAQELLRRADMACSYAVRHSSTPVVVYESGIEAQVVSQRLLIRDLTEAVQESDIQVAFQPIVEGHSGKLVSYEALARWRHPDRGWVSPGVFVPLAEQSGVVDELGETVLRVACRDLQFLRARQMVDEAVSVSVNVSAKQFEDRLLPYRLREVARDFDIPPGNVQLELTESATMSSPDVVAELLGVLRTMGFRVALDDFGTGYSALSVLNTLPIDTLKIDRDFFHAAANDPRADRLLQAVLTLSRDFCYHTVVEGVETQDHLDFALRRGVGMIQGYYYSRPLLLADLLKSEWVGRRAA